MTSCGFLNVPDGVGVLRDWLAGRNDSGPGSFESVYGSLEPRFPARISENVRLVVRSSRLLLLLVVASAAVAALVVPGSAFARVAPLGAQFKVIRVGGLSDGEFATLARRGAVGLMRPGFGPTTSHRSAFDQKRW